MRDQRKLKLVGFFKEMAHGNNDDPCMADSRRQIGQPDEARMAAYLRGGHPFIVSPGVVYDALDGSGPVGTGSILTDGEWAWPDDLAHHIEKYHLVLPDSFVESVIAADFHSPVLTKDQLRKLRLP